MAGALGLLPTFALLKTSAVKKLIESYPQHLQQAAQTVAETSFRAFDRAVHQIVITGLGGSGIGGSMAAEWAAGASEVPVWVNKGYELPAFVNRFTAVIVCSYSGNTEETLHALAQAEERGAMILAISSGGQLAEKAREKNWNLLSMEGGNPPRSMLGYSAIFLLHYLRQLGVKLPAPDTTVQAARKLLSEQAAALHQQARQLAEALDGTVPQLLATTGNVALATRWRQQLNENAKMLAWEAEVPEMNHNELVGWEGGDERFSVVFLRHEHDLARNQKRLAIIEEIIRGKTQQVHTVWSRGANPVERHLYLIHLGDWLSYYLAEKRGVDIIDIRSIDRLKSELGKIPF